MKVKDRISLSPQKQHRGWMIACIAVICVMVIGIGSLSVYTALTVSEQQRFADSQAASLAELEQQLQQAQSELEQQKQALEQARSEAEAASGTISEQEKTISDQEKAISDQQKTIEELRQQIALKQLPNSSSQTSGITPPAGVDGLKGKKLVALTFDDGPGPCTAQLLDLLKKEQVKATFFVLGTKVNAYPELVKRMDAEGHEVGNHSQNHKNLAKLSADGVKMEMDTCANKIKALIGHDPTVMRCPGGSCNETVKTYAKNKGIPIIQWDVDTRDWESRNTEAILKKTFTGSAAASDGSIVLLHDIHKSTVDTVPQIIQRFKEAGYTFVTVSELLHARYETVEAGKMYFDGCL